MSSSAPRPGERMIHQDFIARIRFSNALPPPPNPPKLLDIPNTGLASGQYTTPGFASRLAREQPLNIEVDAELGMPLDLVGMPGVFDGDESSIQPPAQQPPVHPHDRALLRPITALGKPKVAEANVSFLRRTEYISSIGNKHQQTNSYRGPLLKKPIRTRRPEAAADSPEVIKRKIDKSFELAEQYLKDPKRIKHPTKRNLTLVSARPFLPDLDSLPDSGTFATIKFLVNPVQSGSKYDTSLQTGMFRPVSRTAEEEQALDAAMEAHNADPENNPRPPNLLNYEYYLPRTTATGENFRRKFDPEDPDKDDENLYTDQTDDGGCFQFKKHRAYETAQDTEIEHENRFDMELLLAVNDKDSFPRQKAVYYYPISQKSTIRPQRTRNIARTIGIENEEETVDQLDVKVEDPTEASLMRMKHTRENPLVRFPEAEEDEETAEQMEDDSNERARTRASRSPSEDHDADGAEDDD